VLAFAHGEFETSDEGLSVMVVIHDKTLLTEAMMIEGRLLAPQDRNPNDKQLFSLSFKHVFLQLNNKTSLVNSG
jgi:hypothetical protein